MYWIHLLLELMGYRLRFFPLEVIFISSEHYIFIDEVVLFDELTSSLMLYSYICSSY